MFVRIVTVIRRTVATSAVVGMLWLAGPAQVANHADYNPWQGGAACTGCLPKGH